MNKEKTEKVAIVCIVILFYLLAKLKVEMIVCCT